MKPSSFLGLDELLRESHEESGMMGQCDLGFLFVRLFGVDAHVDPDSLLLTECLKEMHHRPPPDIEMMFANIKVHPWFLRQGQLEELGAQVLVQKTPRRSHVAEHEQEFSHFLDCV